MWGCFARYGRPCRFVSSDDAVIGLEVCHVEYSFAAEYSHDKPVVALDFFAGRILEEQCDFSW